MRKIVVANWKMNPRTAREAGNLLKKISRAAVRVKKTEVVICPPAIYFTGLKGTSRKIILGAQDAFFGDVGAFTGEVSAEMLYELGVKYVILGHSERRALGETNALINKKIKGALVAGLTPILCVGELARDESHTYFDIVKAQIKECLAGVSRDSISKIIVAYEPVWAISTTKERRDATPGDSLEMALFIRKVLSDISTPLIGGKTRILYGGSVNERDAEGFLREGGVDGLLVGKASLDPQKFGEIVKLCEASTN